MEGIKPPAAATTSPTGRKDQNRFGFIRPLLRRAGYTLIELVLAALIIAILVGISMPRFRNTFSDLELRNASYNMARLISYAQQKAIREGRFFRINFDFEKNKYWLSAGDDLKKFKRIKDRYGKVYTLPKGISLKGEKKTAIFFPNGAGQKIDVVLEGRRSKFGLKSTGRLGYVDVKRLQTE